MVWQSNSNSCDDDDVDDVCELWTTSRRFDTMPYSSSWVKQSLRGRETRQGKAKTEDAWVRRLLHTALSSVSIIFAFSLRFHSIPFPSFPSLPFALSLYSTTQPLMWRLASFCFGFLFTPDDTTHRVCFPRYKSRKLKQKKTKRQRKRKANPPYTNNLNTFLLSFSPPTRTLFSSQYEGLFIHWGGYWICVNVMLVLFKITKPTFNIENRQHVCLQQQQLKLLLINAAMITDKGKAVVVYPSVSILAFYQSFLLSRWQF